MQVSQRWCASGVGSLGWIRTKPEARRWVRRLLRAAGQLAWGRLRVFAVSHPNKLLSLFRLSLSDLPSPLSFLIFHGFEACFLFPHHSRCLRCEAERSVSFIDLFQLPANLVRFVSDSSRPLAVLSLPHVTFRASSPQSSCLEIISKQCFIWGEKKCRMITY